MKNGIMILLCALWAVPLYSHADASMTMSGNVVASPCTVDTGTVNKTVELGTIQRRDVQTAGEGGSWTDFDLLVKNCPAGTSKVAATMTGTADAQDSTAWKNSGTSSNVALRITSRDHNTVYAVNSTMQVHVDTSTRSTTFPLSARIFTPEGSAVAGTFTSVMNVNFTYQ